MTAFERLKRAGKLLDQAVAEIEDAEEGTPPYSQGALRFLKAELIVSRRRIQNVHRVIGQSR